MSGKLTFILDKMAPIKCIQVRTKYAPWMSQNTKDKIKVRDNAQKKAAETKNHDDWLQYKSCRNSVNSILKSEKKRWQQTKLENFGNDSSSVWKNLKLWLGWSKGGPPTRLIQNGRIITRPRDLAETMNKYFINKIKLLREKLPTNLGNPLDLVSKLMRNRKTSFQFKPVHPDEIDKIITNLKVLWCG